MLLLFLFVLLKYDYQFASALKGGELRCIVREREALLKFKQGLIDEDDILSSWGSEEHKKECCNWKGIKCNNETGHVISLQLSQVGGKVTSSLLELNYLNHLNLNYNDFGYDEIPQFIGSLSKLQHLNLKDSNFSGVVPHQLGNLTTLRTLDIGYNELVFENVKLLQGILKFPHLTELYLSRCQIPTHFFVNSSSTTLSVLHLSGSGLTSSSFQWLLNISTSLRSIDLSHNNLSVVPNAFGQLSRLEHLDLSANQITGYVPDLRPLISLEESYLNHNKFKSLPTSLWQLSMLENLNVSFNSFEGTISEDDLSKLHNLKALDLSYNSLILNFTADWVPPFQLNDIRLASCNIGPYFPAWLRTQADFFRLDLSCANISDELPKWFWDLSPRISYLNLSHNQISGPIPDLLSNFVDLPVIDISSNHFSGHLPSFHPKSMILQLSGNRFLGPISSICSITYDALLVLDLSDNQFSGELPDCWEDMKKLHILNLADNKFYGHIPHNFGSLLSLRTLHLRGNNFSGELPSTLKNCQKLVMIDVGENQLTGNIPAWIGTHLRTLIVLSLGHNNFDSIPPEICHLTEIQILDVSKNSISGRIPRCFDNFTSLVQKNITTKSHIFEFPFGRYPFYGFTQYIGRTYVQWKGQETECRKTLGLQKLIDLSRNKLVGNIPREFAHLGALISLNLSRNNLTGNIISNIGQMKMLESLDLSRNQFFGEIPIGLAELHFLSVLDLSNNNLSGKIPSSTQLQSFNASVYGGNNELCGNPLIACPGDGPNPRVIHTKKQDDGDVEDDNLITQGVFISMAMGFILGFWGAVTFVIKNS